MNVVGGRRLKYDAEAGKIKQRETGNMHLTEHQSAVEREEPQRVCHFKAIPNTVHQNMHGGL